ncbi:MAG: NAD(P)-binding domain-containing protein [Acidobacteriota bacterium]
MTLAILGAGSVGAALGQRFTETGHRIVFGTRPGKDLNELLAQCGDRARQASVAEAVNAAEVVFHAVPSEVAVEALAVAELSGKIVVDCTNPLAWDDGPVWDPPAEGSVTAQLAAAYPQARWVKGFATFGAAFHRHPTLAGPPVEVHLASDDDGAKARVADIAQATGFSPVDCGPLRNAAVLENLAILWIHLASAGGHGREFAFQMLKKG